MKIMITEAIRQRIYKEIEAWGPREFKRQTGLNRNFKQDLKKMTCLSQEVQEKLSKVIILDDLKEGTQFQVHSFEDIERMTDLPISEYFNSIEEAVNVNAELGKAWISKMDEFLYDLIERHPNSPFIWGMAYSIGSKHLEGRSMMKLAKDIGCSRAALSKFATYCKRRYSLPPSPYMRSEANVELSRELAKEYHKKRKK